MKIGPKFKIARRLGAPIFEKTQTQKFALSEEKKSRKSRPRQKTDYGLQMAEKQKARFFYGVTEKQFKNYVNKALTLKGTPSSELFTLLEMRLDNVVWRLGFASTHGAARQMVSHGHICVNGVKARVASTQLKIGDVISIREGSKKSPLFLTLLEKGPEKEAPSWITFDNVKKEATIKSKPVMVEHELYFNLGQVIEFYQR